MKTINKLMSLGVLALAGLMPATFTVQAQTNTNAAAGTGGKVGTVEKANQIIGKNVFNRQGEAIGKINNLVVDLTSGRVLYAIVDEQGGVPGVDRYAIPPEKFSTGGSNGNLVVDVKKADLASAPKFKGGAKTINSVDYAQQVYQHFGQPAWWQGGGATGAAGAFGNVQGAKQLMGKEVKTAANQDLGQIKNLVVDLAAARVLYVALAPQGSQGNMVYVVPPNAFTSGSDGTLVTGLDEAKLQGGPHFADNSWPDVASSSYATQVYQYYGKQPYFNSQLSPTSRQP